MCCRTSARQVRLRRVRGYSGTTFLARVDGYGGTGPPSFGLLCAAELRRDKSAFAAFAYVAGPRSPSALTATAEQVRLRSACYVRPNFGATSPVPPPRSR